MGISAQKQHPKEHLQYEIVADVIFEKCSLYHACLSADNIELTHSHLCFKCLCFVISLCFSFPLLYFPFLTTPLISNMLFVSCISFFFSDVTNFPFPDEFSQTLLILSCSSSSETTLEANVFKCYSHYLLYKLKIQCWQDSKPAYFNKFQGQQLVNFFFFPLCLGQ